MGWLTPRVWSKTIWGMNVGSSIDGTPLRPELTAICSSDCSCEEYSSWPAEVASCSAFFLLIPSPMAS